MNLKKRICFLLLYSCALHSVLAFQWKGDTSHFKFTSNQIQLYGQSAGKSVVKTRFELLDTMSWEGVIKLSFAPSSNNFTQISLIDEDSIRLFVQIGKPGKDDGLDIFQSIHGKDSLLFQGKLGTFGSGGEAAFSIRKEQQAFMVWTAYESDTLKLEGSFSFPCVLDSSWFSFSCNYTSSNATKFYLKNLSIGAIKLKDEKEVGPYTIVINELMVDPIPSLGTLPEGEYIEVKNYSDGTIDLTNWTLKVNQSEVSLPSISMAPGKIIVLTKEGINLNLPDSIHFKLGSIPSLTNTGGTVQLFSASNTLIHSIEYSPEQFSERFKKDGGWSLELQDVNYPCLRYSWDGSEDVNGGTPGKENSSLIDIEVSGNYVKQAYIKTPELIIVDLAYQVTTPPVGKSILINDVVPDSVWMNSIGTRIYLKPKFELNTSYQNRLTWGDSIQLCDKKLFYRDTVLVGQPVFPDHGELLINEILFDPIGDESDFVELVNTSSNFLDLKNVQFAMVSSGSIEKLLSISDSSLILAPKDVIVFSKNCKSTIERYPFGNQRQCAEFKNLPNLSNSYGIVTVTNQLGTVLDQVIYNDSWHFSGLSSTEGISLERISQKVATQDSINWTSAAGSYLYGTPGSKNSQSYTNNISSEMLRVSDYFSPNNDGVRDFLEIQYQLSGTNYFSNIHVFDESGVLLKSVKENLLLNKEGIVFWDGELNNGTVIKPGNYILLVEVLNLEKRSVYVSKKSFSVVSAPY